MNVRGGVILTADFTDIGLGVIQTYGTPFWASYSVRLWFPAND